MDGWNNPDVTPEKPGEYRAALDPADASPNVRRWWSGFGWSNPYFCTNPEVLKDRIRKEASALRAFWMPA